ncbi:glycosyltransferase family 1 protein [Megasphaera paucivorans]|uniref:Uncharacterized protein n=1 Tax=Megasphaera paucivorans TaxID=349095 RepID=A0A1G9PVY5_9FIRM|nr:hypothetical protein [Megasphaera paucivorans]SDM02962.1 hypothetical protein SAMN05660299_00020 [Megasphaera paucivorans]
MRVAILETVKTNGGFEQEFDRLIINELKRQGHTPILYLPENSKLSIDFDIPIEYMSGGEIVDYEGAGKIKKIWLSIQRENRRVKWFDSAYKKACKKEIDAIVLTTATYRYLRSLHRSKLKDSPIPIIFIFLGVNPHEKPKFIRQAQKCLSYRNIKLKITTLRDDFKESALSNVELIKPPVLVPAEIKVNNHLMYKEPIRIGFFGHYRKGEKDIEGIINAFVKSGMTHKAELIIQAAPTMPEDAVDLDRIMNKYQNKAGITFIKGKLYGQKWYSILSSMDVLFLPYSDKRYLYNWSAVYFNALGLYKSVLVTKFLNPEILSAYDVGIEVDLQDLNHMSVQIHDFLEQYEKKIPIYQNNLDRVNRDFGTENFLYNILK